MSFAEEAAVGRGYRDGDCPPVREAQCQRSADDRNVGHFVVGGPFDSMHAGDRHSRADKHALIARDGITNTPQECSIPEQISYSCELLDQFERRVLHSAILLAPGRAVC